MGRRYLYVRVTGAKFPKGSVGYDKLDVSSGEKRVFGKIYPSLNANSALLTQDVAIETGAGCKDVTWGDYNELHFTLESRFHLGYPAGDLVLELHEGMRDACIQNEHTLIGSVRIKISDIMPKDKDERPLKKLTKQLDGAGSQLELTYRLGRHIGTTSRYMLTALSVTADIFGVGSGIENLMDLMAPTDPMEPTDPLEPTDPMEPMDPMAPNGN